MGPPWHEPERADHAALIRCAAVVHASELQLPDFDTTDTGLHGEQFHEVMTGLARRSWLARTPLGYCTLDRDAGEYFLRTARRRFPGVRSPSCSASTDGPLHEQVTRNIININGDAHRRLRSLVNPALAPAGGRPLPTGDARVPGGALGAGSRPTGAASWSRRSRKPYPALTIARSWARR